MSPSEKLESFINLMYRDSDNMSIAVRDVLTDLMHIAKRHNIDLSERFDSAEEVFKEEVANGVS